MCTIFVDISLINALPNRSSGRHFPPLASTSVCSPKGLDPEVFFSRAQYGTIAKWHFLLFFFFFSREEEAFFISHRIYYVCSSYRRWPGLTHNSNIDQTGKRDGSVGGCMEKDMATLAEIKDFLDGEERKRKKPVEKKKAELNPCGMEAKPSADTTEAASSQQKNKFGYLENIMLHQQFPHLCCSLKLPFQVNLSQ